MSGRRRCEVVTHPAVFAPYNRPYVIASTDPHPDYPDQYVALGLTTQEVTAGVVVGESDWAVGRLSERSFIDPRYPVAISERGVADTVGALRRGPVDEAVSALAELIGAA